MGLMDGFKRFMQGKPVFEVPQNPMPPNNASVDNSTSPEPTPEQPTPATGPKTAPLVYIERLDNNNSNVSNPYLDCELHIRNHSTVPVRLERLDLLGQSFVLNKTYVQPGQEWEYRVHTEHRPITNNYHEAKLYYETEDGDDFCAAHTVEYLQLPDHTYNIVRLHFIPPVRDV